MMRLKIEFLKSSIFYAKDAGVDDLFLVFSFNVYTVYPDYGQGKIKGRCLAYPNISSLISSMSGQTCILVMWAMWGT